jgi:hypothetical protein
MRSTRNKISLRRFMRKHEPGRLAGSNPAGTRLLYEAAVAHGQANRHAEGDAYANVVKGCAQRHANGDAHRQIRSDERFILLVFSRFGFLLFDHTRILSKGERLMEQTELSVLLQAVNTAGVVGLLGFMVLAFYRGDLIARSLLDRILALYEKQLTELTERILKRLEEVAMKGGRMKE